MKKYISILFTIFLIGILTGCTNAIPELSESDEQAVCEYAAQLLLSHTKHYNSTVLSQEEADKAKEELLAEAALRAAVEAQKAAEALEEANDGGTSTGDSSDASPAEPVYQDIDEFLGLNGISIDYAGYIICDTYPDTTEDNDWQGICSATGNNKLVVFKFNVANNTGEDYFLDIASLKANFSFKVDGRISKSALTTLLANDLLMFRGDLLAGESVETVVIIEMSPDDAENISTVNMTLKYDGNKSVTTLF